jgi:hypothetical protein
LVIIAIARSAAVRPRWPKFSFAATSAAPSSSTAPSEELAMVLATLAAARLPRDGWGVPFLTRVLRVAVPGIGIALSPLRTAAASGDTPKNRPLSLLPFCWRMRRCFCSSAYCVDDVQRERRTCCSCWKRHRLATTPSTRVPTAHMNVKDK